MKKDKLVKLYKHGGAGQAVWVNPCFVTHISQAYSPKQAADTVWLQGGGESKLREDCCWVHVLGVCTDVMQNCVCYCVEGSVNEVAELLSEGSIN